MISKKFFKLMNYAVLRKLFEIWENLEIIIFSQQNEEVII